MDISGIILSHWETLMRHDPRPRCDQWTNILLCVTANICNRELTAPVVFPVSSEASCFRILTGHQEWGKRIYNIPTLFWSLHPAFGWEPFTKLERAQALPTNALVWKVPCPVPEAVSGTCWAVQLLPKKQGPHPAASDSCWDHPTQEDTERPVPLPTRRICGMEEPSRCCNWGGLGLFYAEEKRQPPRRMLSASPWHDIHHSDSPWPGAVWEKHPWHAGTPLLLSWAWL